VPYTTCDSIGKGYVASNESDTATCKACREAIENCKDCKYVTNAYVCLECFDNREVLSSGASCSTCLRTEYNDGTSCKLCSESIVGCVECNTSSNAAVCLKCDIGYYMDATGDNCYSCSDTGNNGIADCIECKLEYGYANATTKS
jgi:hypothetical protein